MIDLSHLTDEEQEMIRSVLRRDGELKIKEEQRIKKLQKTEQDKFYLKYLTGEWFYKSKSNRHRDKMHGCDIVRASMSRRKPVTIMELTQIWPEKSSYLKNESKDIFIPPELSGLIEPSSSAHNRDEAYNAAENKSPAHPQTKPRQNPFNSRPIVFESPVKTEGHLQTAVKQVLGTVSLPSCGPQIPAEGNSGDPSSMHVALKKDTVRPLSISKSLEDLATLSSGDEQWKNEPRIGVIQTAEEAQDLLSIAVLDPKQSRRLSVSVPDFMHEQSHSKESDCLSVTSFCSERQRKNSITNTSASSGLASMSSVSGSVTNLQGTDFGHVEVKGTIQFAINYVNKLEELHIFIAQCKNLAVANPKRNRSDPYIKCYLLPDKLGKRKTSVKKKTLNPTYNEILRYKIPLESLKMHTLNISVWHNDMFWRNSFLGEVNVDLSKWDNNTHMMEQTLEERVATPCSPNHTIDLCGDVRISLRFLVQTSQSNKTPQTGELHVWVKECTNLLSRRGTIDTFVKCSILPARHQNELQKSRVVKRTANPVFNHTMVFDGLKPEDLRDTCVELTVWDHDRLSNHFIGGTRLNLGTGKSYGTEVKWMDSNSAESALWTRMMEVTNKWVEETIPFRMLTMAR